MGGRRVALRTGFSRSQFSASPPLASGPPPPGFSQAASELRSVLSAPGLVEGAGAGFCRFVDIGSLSHTEAHYQSALRRPLTSDGDKSNKASAALQPLPALVFIKGQGLKHS